MIHRREEADQVDFAGDERLGCGASRHRRRRRAFERVRGGADDRARRSGDRVPRRAAGADAADHAAPRGPVCQLCLARRAPNRLGQRRRGADRADRGRGTARCRRARDAAARGPDRERRQAAARARVAAGRHTTLGASPRPLPGPRRPRRPAFAIPCDSHDRACAGGVHRGASPRHARAGVTPGSAGAAARPRVPSWLPMGVPEL
jgi:hypothetical protein